MSRPSEKMPENLSSETSFDIVMLFCGEEMRLVGRLSALADKVSLSCENLQLSLDLIL